MTFQFKFNNKLSLYIPSVLEELATDDGIRHYLQRFGHIEAVNIIRSSKEGVYKAVVHFDEWYDDEYSQKWQRDVMNPTVRAELDIGVGFLLLLPKWKMQKQNVKTMPGFGTTYKAFSDLIDEIDECWEASLA